MKPFKKWFSTIRFVAVSIVIITGCGHRDVPVPSGITATPGNGQVTISWTAQTDATSYNIYWSTIPGVTTVNGTPITGVASPYIHSGLTSGTTYYYIVTAVNKDGESAPSSEVSATLAKPAPTGVSATPGNGQVTIVWTAQTDATSYNIYWSTTPGVTIATGTKITGAASPYIHSGLSNGTTYYYVVTAGDSIGESAPSSEVSAIPAVRPTPAAPTEVTATPGNGQVTIAWTPVSGATSYNIYWSNTPGVTTANGSKITGVASPYIDSGLINDSTYYYVVTAVNNDGESTPSSQVSAIPSVAPFIRATVLSVTGGTNPFGWLQQVSVCIDSTCNTAIPDATVTINGNILPYDAAKGKYQGNVAIASGGAIDLKVTLAVNTVITYGLSASQHATPPAPALASAWLRTNANTISWTTTASTAGGAYIVGIMNVSGNIVYPSPAGEVRNGFLEVPPDSAAFTVPANSLPAGSFYVFSGIATPGVSTNAPGTGISIPGALSGSGLWVGLISSFLPITVL
ncbi:MAG: fibronectin type III domain-containing protein [Syntrophales bacterium]